MNKPSLNIVKSKIHEFFPNKDEEEIMARSRKYGTESYEKEKRPIYLAT